MSKYFIYIFSSYSIVLVLMAVNIIILYMAYRNIRKKIGNKD
ncbi:MAG: heme exporter protein CcmD [Pelagibacterales bacterium]|nr:heme exporter protein CcmD [Pelagibacterales bacterium]